MLAFALAMVGALVSASPAAAADIASAGPLTLVRVSPNLNCDVRHASDTSPEWYGYTACATLVSVGGVLYGPSSIPAGGGATGVTGYTAVTPISQAGPTGTGTHADPFTVITVVGLGSTGMRLTQTDSYVVGEESYRTDIRLTTSSGTGVPAKVYRGGDCYLQDSDRGYGRIDYGSAPLCVSETAGSNRIEGFYPLTAGSRYMEASYSQIWTAIGSQQNLPNTDRGTERIDNGVAINWDITVPPGTSGTTLSSLTVFSPVGAAPVSFAKTADQATVAAGATDGYTVTVSNPGVVPITLTSITDTLASGVNYTVGSTTGGITADPTGTTGSITWNGSFVVPAASGTTPGTFSFHFEVTMPTVPGDYTNSITGAGNGVTVIPANQVATITVTAATNPPPTVDAGPDQSAAAGSTVTLDGTATDTEPLTTAWTAVPGPGTGAGDTCTFANPASVDTTVVCAGAGSWTLTLTADDGTNPPVSDSMALTLTPTPQTVTVRVQFDTYTWGLKGKLPSAYYGRKIASFDDDGKLPRGEDLWVGKKLPYGKYVTKRPRVFDLTLPVGYTKAQLIAAANAAADAARFPRIKTTAKLPNNVGSRGQVTDVWILDPTATMYHPWGPGKDKPQIYLGRG